MPTVMKSTSSAGRGARARQKGCQVCSNGNGSMHDDVAQTDTGRETVTGTGTETKVVEGEKERETERRQTRDRNRDTDKQKKRQRR